MSRSSGADPAETLSPVTIRLCGRLVYEAGGREIDLRGRQARLVVAYLAWNRQRPVARDELIGLLWPDAAPANPDDVLSALLSKVRSALGPGALEGRRELALALPGGAWIDVEAASADLDRAEAAFARGSWAEVCRAGHDALDVTAAPFLLAHDHPWVEERRREIEELRLRTSERVGTAALALGGSGIGAAERSARAIVAAAPFRERGHALLMEALAARGDVAEALRVYEDLRVRLRDELGTAPGAATRALHERLLTAGETVPPPSRAERKLVTVLALEADAREEVERLEGGLHGAVAVFGIPRAHEDDAERAVEVALRLGGRAGVATGEVVVGDGEPEGDVLARAPELLAEAPERTVLVDELTARLTEHAVTYEGGRQARTFRTVRRPPRTSFVGREHDLALLEAAHRAVIEEGRPRLVVVVGEAGAGKSRLVDELLHRAREALPEADVLIGRCLAYGDNLTYWPLRELLWSAAGILLQDSAAAAGEKLRRLVERVAGEPERTVAALAVTAGITLPGNPLAAMAPESVAEEVGLAWPRLASGLAAHGGAVLVVEDLHWAEPALLDMLEHVVARSTGPLLVVVTARPELLESRPGWGGRRAASQVVLEPLTGEATQRLVAELLPGATPAVHGRVVAHAEGNPFFAEEIAHHLLDRGVRLAGELPIPTTVRAVLAARIDALPPGERRALQDAAVVGRSFWASSIEATGAAPAALRALEERGLVTTRPTSSLPGQTELWFRHALIREVAYRTIPDEQRRAVHAGVGEWLEALASDRREEFVDLLAHHFERAGGELRPRAVQALIEAGHGARRRAASDDAVQFADRALAIARAAGECLAALELKARALHDAVKADEALAAYQAALDLARGADAERLRADAVLLCARYPGAFTRGDWRDWAVAQIEAGLRESGDRDTLETGALLIGRASMVRWFVLSPLELEQARAAAERAIAIAERVGSTRLLSHGLEALGWRDADHGFCDAGDTADRMLQLVGRMPDRLEAAETIVIAAICLLRAGRFEQARSVAAEACAMARSMSPHRRLHAASAATTCLLGAGRFGELAEATAEAAELVEHEGSRTCAMASLALAGHAVARFEELDARAGARAAAGVEAVGLHRSDSSFRYRGIEVLRPFVGLERTRARLERTDPARGMVDGVHHLRALVQLVALEGGDELDPLLGRARRVSRQACAPPLAWIADWAEAVRAGSLAGAVAATDALAAYGERYTAARLMVDALLRLGDDAATEATAARLSAMGALASAAELSGTRAA
ncbi:MAG TPA: BTAD domain-containing putative transcriptional regulator [Solirubrobacteraceae bacterium]|nr:BTAD domain-containing putative transcriptional regulator [Solirubrobacteraceae bacterium]